MNYLIIGNIYLALFYAFYRLFLAKETFFQINRVYLIGSAFLAFVLPLVHLDWLQRIFESSSVFVARTSLDAVTVYANPQMPTEIHTTAAGLPWWLYVYIGGCCVQLLFLINRYVAIRRLLKENNLGDAYSFLGTIKVDNKQEGSDRVLEHERVHVRQRHSIDILFIELIRLFNWFNPVVYWFAKSVRLVHEYIADEAINKSYADKIAYAELLIGRTFAVSPATLANSFRNQSAIKNRITMLFKDKSTRPALFKYLLAMPLFIAMLVFSSAKVSDRAGDLTSLTILSEPDIDTFYNLVAQKINYIKEARENQAQGIVDVAFEYQNGEIKSLKTSNTIGYTEDKEVERVFRLSEVKRVMPEGKYVLRIKFILWKVSPKELDPPIVSPADHELLKVITIVGYPGTDQTSHTTESNVPPPPPPLRKKGVMKKESGNEKDSEKQGNSARLAEENIASRQEKSKGTKNVEDFNKVEVPPMFPGGLHAFYQWVATHYRYPKEATKQGVSGAIHLSFIVNEDGSLSDIRTLRDLGYGTGEEAIRMLKESPKWQPGTNNEKAVKVAYSLPIKLNLKGMDGGKKTGATEGTKLDLDSALYIFNGKKIQSQGELEKLAHKAGNTGMAMAIYTDKAKLAEYKAGSKNKVVVISTKD